MLRQLQGKAMVYAKMKFEEYERLEAEQEKNLILVWPLIEELMEDMKAFYWLKTNARQALEKLKKKHQRQQRIDKFLRD